MDRERYHRRREARERAERDRPSVIMARRPRIWVSLILQIASLASLTASMGRETWTIIKVQGQPVATTGPWHRCVFTPSDNHPCYGIFASSNVSPLLFATQSGVFLTFVFIVTSIVYAISCMRLKPSRKLSERATYLTLSNLFALVTSIATVVCYAIGDRADITHLLANEGTTSFRYDVTDSFWLAGMVAIMYLLSFIIVSIEFANRDTMRILLTTM